MNLDTLELFKQIDSQNRLAEIDALPESLHTAWTTALNLPLPFFSDIQRIVVVAQGDAALAADLVLAAISAELHLPLVITAAGLPAFAKEASTLVICMGRSETLTDAVRAAVSRSCSVCLITDEAQGELGRQVGVWAVATALPVVTMAGMLLALCTRLNLIADPSAQVEEAIVAMQTSQAHLRADVPAAHNPAKRYAGQLVGRWVTCVGAGLLSPVAKLWKARINRMAKAPANVELLPDAAHHAAFATSHPAEVLNARTMTMFLRAPTLAPDEVQLLDQLRQHFMLEGMNTDVVDARGVSPLANIWTLILFGDYMAYYLAMAYGVDPA